MEYIDPQMAQRVWQRVNAKMPPPTASPDLLALIEEELSDAATYLYLSRFFPGRQALHHLHRQEQSHAACLKGIYRMMTGKRPTPRLPKPPREKPESALRRCYERELQSLAQYESRSSDPKFGQTFSRMAAQEREHCRILLELMGNLQK